MAILSAIASRNPLLLGPDSRAVQERPVTCAHCGAKLRVNQLDYDCKKDKLPAELADKFVKLDGDADTKEYIDRCLNRPRVYRHVMGHLARLLRMFFSRTTANGILNKGGMFVMSKAQASKLLGRDESDHSHGALLDVGAGDGKVTENLLPLYKQVVVTETSFSMVHRLRQSGKYAAVVGTGDVSVVAKAARKQGVALSGPNRNQFDGLVLFNVLDRCDAPLTLLRHLKRMLVPNTGRLLMAVVLPFRPFVESGTKRTPPKEKLGLNPDADFETSLKDLYEKVLKPEGFIVEQVSRLPYLCEGEFDCPMFTLDDAVLTLSVRDHTVPFSEQSAQPTTSGDEADDEPPPLSETSET